MMNLNGLFGLMAAVLIGAVILGFTYSGQLSPVQAAQAEGIHLQNQITAERDQFSLEQNKKVIAANAEQEIKRTEEATRAQRAQNDQHLDHQERAFVQESVLKDWSVRALVLGCIAVAVILALGVGIVITMRAWAMVAQASAKAQIDRNKSLVNGQSAALLRAIGQLNTSMDSLLEEQTRSRQTLYPFMAQCVETKTKPASPVGRNN